MNTIPVTVNLRPFKITQFDSIKEVLATLPEPLVLQWLNIAWRNTQMLKLMDALKERR